MDWLSIKRGPGSVPIVHNSDRYEFIKDIGGGNFGKVWLLKDKQVNELVAAKYIERGDRVRLVFFNSNSCSLYFVFSTIGNCFPVVMLK